MPNKILFLAIAWFVLCVVGYILFYAIIRSTKGAPLTHGENKTLIYVTIILYIGLWNYYLRETWIWKDKSLWLVPIIAAVAGIWTWMIHDLYLTQKREKLQAEERSRRMQEMNIPPRKPGILLTAWRLAVLVWGGVNLGGFLLYWILGLLHKR